MSIFIVWSPGDLTGLVRWWMNQDGDQFSKGKRSQRRTGRKEPAPPDNHPKILTGKATVYKQTIDRFVLHSFFAPYCPNTNRKSCYRSLCFLLPLTEHSPIFIFNNLSFLWFLQRFFFFCCCFYTSFFIFSLNIFLSLLIHSHRCFQICSLFDSKFSWCAENIHYHVHVKTAVRVRINAEFLFSVSKCGQNTVKCNCSVNFFKKY